MKKILSALTVSAAVALSTGCSTIDSMYSYEEGNRITSEQMSTLKVGKTTRTDAVELLGTPSDIAMVGNQQHYIYNYTLIHGFKANESQSIRLIFDKNDRLAEVQKGKGSSNNPLLKG